MHYGEDVENEKNGANRSHRNPLGPALRAGQGVVVAVDYVTNVVPLTPQGSGGGSTVMNGLR
jgi:hypothetical protein